MKLIQVGGFYNNKTNEFKDLYLPERMSVLDGYVSYLLKETNKEEIGILNEDHIWVKGA